MREAHTVTTTTTTTKQGIVRKYHSSQINFQFQGNINKQ